MEIDRPISARTGAIERRRGRSVSEQVGDRAKRRARGRIQGTRVRERQTEARGCADVHVDGTVEVVPGWLPTQRPTRGSGSTRWPPP